MVIVEALACGLPVLTSRIAGAAVCVREGETGELLEDPADVGEIVEKLRKIVGEGYSMSVGGEEGIAASVCSMPGRAYSCRSKSYFRVVPTSGVDVGEARFQQGIDQCHES